MTARTPKDVTEDAEEAPAAEVEAPGEDAAGGEASRPARRKRRVRVIEVIDDDDDDLDLDDVLKSVEEEERREPRPKPKPAARPRPKPAEPVEADTDDDSEDSEDSEDAESAAPRGKKARPAPVNVDAAPAGSAFGMTRTAAVVTVVLVAALASLAIWQWTSASSLSSAEQDRRSVEKVAAAYGNAALNYNAANYQSQMDKAQKLMAGDLLDNFKQCTLPNLGNTFKEQPELALTSKTAQTFVGSVDERFATATVSVDVTVRSKTLNTDVPANLIRLSLSKVGGDWKVTQQFASGNNQQKRGCDDGGLAVPGGGTGTDKGKEKDTKPKN
ncbi:hypothetical protein GCM10009678_22730 [Actinomadura kijaniata]|uniref:Mce-associated membrane protein n=1 Tax=Actinomadura namibiensis TaxID=182080 RepID=A0A7W3LN12_ACTNM|nr:hypothetical protein [Actinomadura namibiensis]MBA8951138.1 hypothetical protein [Actinomadura namibiensis]